jgi:hypothetical protein
VNDALASLDGEFEALYTNFGRPTIPPERLIRASLIQILFLVRSERQLMEQMQYNRLALRPPRPDAGTRRAACGLQPPSLHPRSRPGRGHRCGRRCRHLPHGRWLDLGKRSEGASLTYSFGHASAHRGETVSTRHDQEGYRDAVWRDSLSKSRGANGSLWFRDFTSRDLVL